MDWKLAITFYYCFRVLQTANVSMADMHHIVLANFVPSCEQSAFGGGGGQLCEGCIFQSKVHTIHPTQLLFVNLTFTDGSETINITIQTKMGKNTDFEDIYSRTRSFKSLIISFPLAVPKDHRYIKVILAGVECARIFEAVHIHYYSVPEQKYLLTSFPASSVPSQSEGRLIVDGKCEPNSDGHPKKPTMTVYSNGTVVREGLCKCKPGFQLNGSICAGCPESKYKNQIGNEPCLSCFANTTRRSDGTGCDCVENFYRAADQQMNFSSICYGPLVSPFNITARNTTGKSDISVILRWDIENEASANTRPRQYSITCPSCAQNRYRFANATTTNKHIVIGNLMAYVTYTLEIEAISEITDITQVHLPSIVTFTTKIGVPGPITNVTYRAAANGDIMFKWEPPVERGGPDLKYKFESGTLERLLDSPTYILRREFTQEVVNFKITPAVLLLNGRLVYGPEPYSRNVKVDPSPPVVTKEISKSVIVGVVIAVVIFVIILLIVIVVLYRRTKRPKHLQVYRMEDGSFEIYRGEIDKSRIYVDPGSYSQIDHAVYNFTTELRSADLEIGKLIGEGEFADVHRGVLRVNNKNVDVAVKKLRIGCSQKDREDFISEAAILGQFDNPNVIRLEGVILKAIPSILILELMANGSLDKYLKEHHSKLSIHQLLGMARGVASGMKYLSDLGYIHRDLAARNVLIDAQENCKISDFGMSRELKTDETYSTRGGKIPIKWTAPEAIQFKKFTTATDVWSYGILLWEIMAFGERPYWDWPNFEVLERIATGYRLPPPPYCPKAVHDLMLDCWQKDRTRRPLFDAILHQLELWIKDPTLLKETFRESVITKDDEIFDYASVFGSLEDWLEAIKMSQYTTFFQERGFISPKQLMNFTLDDLQDIGIAPIGHRKKILKAIRTTRFQLAGREGRRRTVSRSSSSIGYARSRIAKRFSNLANSLQSGHNSIMEKSFDTHETIIT